MNKTAKTKAFKAQLVEHGYSEISTGGGCRAYCKGLENDWYILLTNDGGFDLPESFDELIIVGHYHNDLNAEGFNKEKVPFKPRKFSSFEEIEEFATKT